MKAPVAFPFRAENMPEGGKLIILNGHACSKDEDLQGIEAG